MRTVESTGPPPESQVSGLEEVGSGSGALLETPVGVILAAGSSSRLGGVPKPLARVAGVTLLERVVSTFCAAGVERIIVVVGHASARVRDFVVHRGLDVELVENDDFGLGNGSSLVTGGHAAAGRFLVAMVDHVVDCEAVTRLLASRAAFALAVDSKPCCCDVGEATKVRLEGKRVVAVARELDDYDAAEAGLAVCDLAIVSAAERSLLAGETTWNAVKRRWLAEGGEIEAVDLRGLLWIDVDTPDDVRRAERLVVVAAARKPQDGIVARRLNRRLSWRLSLLLVRAGASPGAATLLAFLLALLAAGALAAGHEWSGALVAGGVLTQIASVADGVDGEIARASLRTSPAGAFFDSVLDRLADTAVLAGLAFASGLDTATWAMLVAALFGTLQVPYVRASYEASFRRPFPPSTSRLGGGRDVRLLIVAVSAVALQPLAGLLAVALLANLELARRLARSWRGPRP
jgi:1L-myo-inositol 1-phosphate cytidylyltransferase / CDP-L-myo-inositol myo-inositolphosphotransferase